MDNFDTNHILHPYAPSKPKIPMLKVVSASGVMLHLDDGSKLIDGMSSWWAAIHGYNVQQLNQAAQQQLEKMSHVMFGGLTHEPAIELAKTLIQITAEKLQQIFFSDSGSVSVEVALKMALQYHQGKGNTKKTKILSFYKAYHGDTFGAMSVCDPITGMHTKFSEVLHSNIFSQAPQCGFEKEFQEHHLQDFKDKLTTNHQQIAAVILEPVVQGAGGMRFYSPKFLQAVAKLCKEYDILLILDEIATGFGRTGKLSAYEHANITPDILCIGKALTGGYLSLAATLTTNEVMRSIEQDGGVLMHGPTFMANPLACAIANASVELLLQSDWKQKIQTIEQQLRNNLNQCNNLEIVQDVRVIGAIGVVELTTEVDLGYFTPAFKAEGVWVRPFLNLVYIMPPYVISTKQLQQLCDAIYKVIKGYKPTKKG